MKKLLTVNGGHCVLAGRNMVKITSKNQQTTKMITLLRLGTFMFGQCVCILCDLGGFKLRGVFVKQRGWGLHIGLEGTYMRHSPFLK